MRTARRLPSVVTMSHPQSYEILLVPAFAGTTAGACATGTGKDSPGTGAEDTGTDESGGAGTDDTGQDGTAVLRSAVVAATGETGASGYPRYAGEGVVAEIDPATHAVEALLVDGAELDIGLSVRVNERGPEPPGDAAGD